MAVEKFTGSPDWDDLRFFRALAELRTLSATARALGVTHATVARRIERLEAQFGAPLFERRPSGYSLTGLGTSVDQGVAEMQRASLAVYRMQQQGRAQLGTVRVSAPRSLSDAFLVPNMHAIRDRIAGIELTVLTESRIVSIAKWEADIAVRLGRPADGSTVARRVGAIRYRLYGRGDMPGDVFVGFPSGDPAAEAAWLERYAADRPFSFRSNSQLAQRAAAGAGLGVALLPSFLAAGDGSLHVVDEEAFPADREVFVISRREALRRPHIRTAFDALVDIFRVGWPA